MVDYSQHKVPDLKKILQERGLVISGNKADLIARLQEDDNKKTATGKQETQNATSRSAFSAEDCLLIQDIPTAGEDEIDWDDDDNKAPEAAPSAPAPAPVVAPTPQVEAAPEPSPAPAPIVDPNQPVTTTESKPAADETATVPEVTTTKPSAEPEAPKPVYTLGVEATDAEKEAEKRAARAKKFGITAPVEDDAAKKLAERAKKFGLETKTAAASVVSGLDSALPDRKRGREDRSQGGRNAKRPTPDRRTEPNPKSKPAGSAPPVPAKKAAAGGRILDDPAEKAKAEARAKKFGLAPKAA